MDLNIGGGYHRNDHYYNRRYHDDGWFGGVYLGYHRPWRYYRPYDRVYCWWPRYHTIYIYGSTLPVVVERPVVSDTDVVVVDPPQVYQTPLQKNIDTALHGEADQRKEAVEKLADYDTMESSAALVDVLINDADGRVRAAAAESLGELQSGAGYEALIRSKHYEFDDEVKLASESAIKRIEDKYGDSLYVSPKMRPMNTGDEKLGVYLEDLRYGNWKTRKEAADHLDDEQGTQAAAALINVVVNDAMSEVRKEAAESLGKIGDRMALPYLEWVKIKDSDSSVCKKAEKAIEKIHDTIL